MKSHIVFFIVSVLVSVNILYGQSVDIALRVYELRMNGQPLEALSVLDAVLDEYPDSARIWFEKGRCLDWVKTERSTRFIHVYTRMSPKIRKSQRCFRKACKLDPENARYYYWLSHAEELGMLVAIFTPWKWPAIPFKNASMIKHAQKAVLYAPDNPEYRYELIRCARGKKGTSAHADTLDLLYPAYGVMAHEFLSTENKPYDSEKHYRDLETTNPEDPVLMRAMRDLFHRLSQKDPSYVSFMLDYAGKSFKLDTDNPEEIKSYCRLLSEQKVGDPIPYISEYFEATTGKTPYHRAVGLQLMARALEERGKMSEAKTYKREAFMLNPLNLSSSINDLEKP